MDTIPIIHKMLFDRWNASLINWNKILNSLSDEQLRQETAPNKNRGIYLLGHMIAAHDDMLILMDMGEKLYPEYHRPFLELADKATEELPSIQELRAAWDRQCEVLNQKILSLNPEQWYEKHTAVSAEDFVQEPYRNKLNIILTRTTHLAYHTGQLILLK